MERLTQEAQIGPFASLRDKAEAKPRAFNDYDCFLAHARAVTALKAYEDICFDEDGKERITIDELSALVKARDEGRVYIAPPPAKEGDPKPTCFYEDGGTIWCLGLAPGGDDEPCDRCKACWYCESGDYADDRAEAEVALGGGGDGR